MVNANAVIQNAASTAVASTANTTQVWFPLGQVNVDTTETNTQITFRSAGVISNFFVNLSANNIGATPSVIITLRIGAANGNESVSPGLAASGVFEDTTNTDTVTSGNLIDVQSVPQKTTGTFSMAETAHHFSANSNTVSRLTCTAPLSVSTSAVTRFFQFHGILSDTATEANTNCRMRKAGTLKNLAVNVTTNTRSTTSTYQSRVGGANGNLVVTYLTNITGVHEDTSNTDTVTVGQDWNWTLVYGTGATAFVTQSIAVDFISTANNGEYIVGRSGGVVYAALINSFDAISGGLKSNTLENLTEVVPRNTITYLELAVLVRANAATSNSTVTLRDAGANTSLVATITATNTGVFLDSADTVTPPIGDNIDYNTINGGGGSFTIGNIELSSVFTSAVVGFARSFNATSLFSPSFGNQPPVFG